MSVQAAQADHNRWRAHQMAKRGTPATTIAKHLGIDPDSVRRYLRQPCPDQPHSQDQSWQTRGLCAQRGCGVDPDAFFPGYGANIDPRVKALCARCPVRYQCRESAIVHYEEFGVWGGTNASERRLLRRQRRAQQGVA